MQPIISTGELQLPERKVQTGVIILMIGLLLPALAAFIAGRQMLGLAALLAPIPFLLITNPKAAFYLFLASLTIYYPVRLTVIALHPFDLAMALGFLSIVADYLLHGRTEIRRTGIDLAWLMMIFTTALSAAFAYNYHLSIVPVFRIIAIYVCFRLVYKMAIDLGVRKILIIYISGVTALAALNIILFIMSGGRVRIFGPAWLAMETFTMTALPMALCFFIWARSRTEQIRFGLAVLIIALGIMATQSRAPMVSVIITLPILITLAWRKTKREGDRASQKRLKNIILLAAFAGIPVIILSSTLFLSMLGRTTEFIESLSNPKGTIALRIVLWTAAIKGFLSSPITGIGIGNFRIVEQIIPAMKTESVWYYIRGLTAHSVVLQYLCETGILGLFALLNLTLVGLRLSYKSFKQLLSRTDNAAAAAIFIATIIFAHTIIYMRSWTWAQDGYVMAIIFGLNAALAHNLSRNRSTATSEANIENLTN